MDTLPVELPARRRRRRHSAEFRAAVVEACQQPGVSIAAVALANGLNANLLRKWVNDAERADLQKPSSSVLSRTAQAEPVPCFLPVALSAPAETASDIRIEVKRNATSISVSWPSSAAAECAAWLRELLR